MKLIVFTERKIINYFPPKKYFTGDGRVRKIIHKYFLHIFSIVIFLWAYTYVTFRLTEIAIRSNKSYLAIFLITLNPILPLAQYHGFTLLHWACYWGDMKVVKYLVTRGANINAGKGKEKTPLHIAAYQGDFKIIKYLISKGADPNTKDDSGNTPLHILANECSHNELGILASKELILGGANINAKNKYGSTPLHIIINAKGDRAYPIVKLFVKYGADVNAKDKNGDTPLHIALGTGQYKTAKLLIENGANLHIRDKYDKTPLDIAKSKHNQEIINLLIEKKLKNKN